MRRWLGQKNAAADGPAADEGMQAQTAPPTMLRLSRGPSVDEEEDSAAASSSHDRVDEHISATTGRSGVTSAVAAPNKRGKSDSRDNSHGEQVSSKKNKTKPTTALPTWFTIFPWLRQRHDGVRNGARAFFVCSHSRIATDSRKSCVFSATYAQKSKRVARSTTHPDKAAPSVCTGPT